MSFCYLNYLRNPSDIEILQLLKLGQSLQKIQEILSTSIDSESKKYLSKYLNPDKSWNKILIFSYSLFSCFISLNKKGHMASFQCGDLLSIGNAYQFLYIHWWFFGFSFQKTLCLRIWKCLIWDRRILSSLFEFDHVRSNAKFMYWPNSE